jgi:hypothetical protein
VNVAPGRWLDVSVVGHPSVTVGGVQLAIAELQEASEAGSDMFAGQPENTGARVSTTITLNEHVAVLPAGLVAVYVTVVVPSANVAPA